MSIKKHLATFERHNRLQRDIDHIDRLISSLEEGDQGPRSSSKDSIKDNLGSTLTESIGPDIVVVLHAERTRLVLEQEELEI